MDAGGVQPLSFKGAGRHHVIPPEPPEFQGLSFISSLKRKICPSAADPSYLGWKGWGKKECSVHAREVSWAAPCS